MDVTHLELILKNIADDLKKSAEEVREANIDELFPEEPSDEFGYVAPILPFLDYVEKALPSEYKVEVEREPHDIYAPLNVHLVKTLEDKTKKMGEDISVKHKNLLRVELASLDAEHGFKEDPAFRKIGDILNKIKLAYEKIEKYQAEDMKI